MPSPFPFIGVDTIENHVHPLHIIVDRNQETILYSQMKGKPEERLWKCKCEI